MRWKLILSAILASAITLPFVFGVTNMGMHTAEAATSPCESAVHCHASDASTDTTAPCVAHCFIAGKQAVLHPTLFLQLLTIAAAALLAVFIAPLLAHLPYRLQPVQVPKRYVEILSVRKRE